ncbi:MAG: hypothetical protein GX804_08645 [Lentisphaerae bacterium]|jgi:uncharacterized protein YxeA|nr:hypothetical protein [Lentisphaerota bacterium]
MKKILPVITAVLITQMLCAQTFQLPAEWGKAQGNPYKENGNTVKKEKNHEITPYCFSRFIRERQAVDTAASFSKNLKHL